MDINEKRKLPPQINDINNTFFKQFKTKNDEKYLNDPNIGAHKKNIVHHDKALLRLEQKHFGVGLEWSRGQI